MSLLNLIRMGATALLQFLPSQSESPIAGSERVTFMNAGEHVAQVHVNFSVDGSVVLHRMYNMYQRNTVYSDLFADNGSSQLCGPMAMANAMMYLKFSHTPMFPAILPQVPASTTAYVRTLYTMCKTDKNQGTRLFELRDCAKQSLADGGYESNNTYVRGIHSNFAEHKVVIGPDDLHLFLRNTWRRGQSTDLSDRAVVLLFGWYKITPIPGTNRSQYVREGGHFVTLSGYNTTISNRFYVSNPLVNYDEIAPGKPASSQISLTPVPSDPNIAPPSGFEGLWQTADILENRTSILEDMIVSVPVQR